MYNSSVNYFHSLLESLVECTDNKEYKIFYRKKITGYGLTHSNFEDIKKGNSRNFAHWKQNLLDLKLIWIPKVKNKQSQDGSNTSTYGRQYMISPLGICSFSSTTDKIGENNAKRIISILKFYSDFTLKWEWEELCKIIGTEEASQLLKQSCDAVKIRDVNKEVHVTLGYNSKTKTSFEFSKYIIRKNKVYFELHEGYFLDESDVIQDPIPLRIMKESFFFTDIAEFILETFCYSIIENCHWNIQNESYILKVPLSTKKEKLDANKTIKKYNTMLEKIPYTPHMIARTFYEERISGNIWSEKKLSVKVFDYFDKQVTSRDKI